MTITTTKLDPDTGDEYFENGRSVIIGGDDATRIDAIKQTCLSHLRTFLGEVFTDTTKGVPWLQSILSIKGVDSADVGGLLRREVLASPEIASCGIVRVTVNDVARSAAVSFHAKATTGEDIVVENEEIV